MARRSPLLKLEGDERLVALIRAGHDRAFEVVVERYEPRLLAFCAAMLKSRQDAEDVLQEVFVNSHKAMLADERRINLRPWLYRIARNRCLNHLRKTVPEGQDSMDVHPHMNGTTTAERVQKREELREVLADVETLPETQRTALLLREIDQMAYEEIAMAMDTTIPAVKSLLVRARIMLAESSEARALSCDEVRLSLAEAAEGIAKASGPVRIHVRDCEGCAEFRKQLRADSRALAAIAPVGLLAFLKTAALGKIFGGGTAAGTATGSGAATGASTAAGAIGGTAAGTATAGGLGAIGGAIGSKAAAGVATAALITAGAVEVGNRGAGESQVPVAVELTAPSSPAAERRAPGPRVERRLLAATAAAGTELAADRPKEAAASETATAGGDSAAESEAAAEPAAASDGGEASGAHERPAVDSGEREDEPAPAGGPTFGGAEREADGGGVVAGPVGGGAPATGGGEESAGPAPGQLPAAGGGAEPPDQDETPAAPGSGQGAPATGEDTAGVLID